MVSDIGFCGARSTELLSLQRPEANNNGLYVIPTTIQAFPHRPAAYFRNVLKRMRLGALRNLVHAARLASWPEVAELLLNWAATAGGVFHLWGHSWEIGEMGQWQELDQVLAAISRSGNRSEMVTNTELCHHAGTHTAIA
jgi:hypothetical protein